MSSPRLSLVWTTLALLAGCVDKTPFAVVKNTCLTNTECAGAGAVCDLTRQQCIREEVDEPYRVILQVRPKRGAVVLPDEGMSLVEHETYEPFELRRAIADKLLEVPLSQQVTGTVLRHVVLDKEPSVDLPVEAQVTFEPALVTFEPEDQTVPISTPTIITTRGGDVLFDNLSANLNPNLRYTVRVQPLGKDSHRLAPFTTSYSVARNDTSGVVFEFPKMARRSGVLRDEHGSTLEGYRIRLEDKQTGAILSSTDTTGEGGTFELYADASVMESQSFYVVVSLKPFSLWDVKVAVDGSRLVPELAVLTIPTAPEPVTYQGSVEAETSQGKGAPAPYADLLFSSRFPIPADRQGGKDWCAWRSASGGLAPRCSARVATTTDPNGRFSVALLPGDYDVFISPSSEAGSRTPLSTTKDGANVLTQLDGSPREGALFELARALHFEGTVESLGLKPMPNVLVNARPLPFTGHLSDDDIYEYARPVTTTTDGRGNFELDIDLGYFDLTVEPPEESGFAWAHSLNRVVRREPERRVGPLQPSPPVPVSGRVQVQGIETPLPGALVEAFAVITKGPGGRRAVRIGQTVSDDTGAYRLALPPAVREDEEDAGMDAGYSEE